MMKMTMRLGTNMMKAAANCHGSEACVSEVRMRAEWQFYTGPTTEVPILGFRVAKTSGRCVVPAVSEWGTVTMILLMLTAVTLARARRRTASVRGCRPLSLQRS